MKAYKRRWATTITILALHLTSVAGLADPLHKIGKDGAWRHEGSGWLFPKQVQDFDRLDAPYTIEGNDDVGAQYVSIANNGQRRATVEIYHVSSLASGAKRDAGSSTLNAVGSEQPFKVETAALTGIKTTYAASDESRAAFYFFATPTWTVTVRATAAGEDESSQQALDALVRALPWETLGSDPGNLHEAS